MTNETADQIAHALSEPNLPLLRRIVAAVGSETALDYLRQTQALLAQGHETAEPGSPLRRQDGQPRTPGGTFIYLARGQMPADKKRELWPPRQKRKKRKRPFPRRPWALTDDLIADLEQKRTGAAEVAIELTGKPEKFSSKRGIVSALLVTEPDAETVPATLPLPPAASKYRVLMQQSDYEPVAAELEAGAALHVKGYCHINTKKGYGMVLAREVTAVHPGT